MRMMLLPMIVIGCALGASIPMPKPQPPQAEGVEILGPFESVPEPLPASRTPDGWDGPCEKLLSIQFTAETGSGKSQWDFPIKCDLARCGSLSLDVCVMSERLKSFMIYLKSGPGGWYRGTVRVPVAGFGRWLRLDLTQAQFPAVEGNPSGWDRIDGLRIVFLRPRGGGDLRTVVALANLTVAPECADAPLVVLSDTADGRRYGQIAIAMIRDMGLTVSVLPESEVTETSFRHRPFVVLPYNPAMPISVRERFKAYLDDGGKAIVSACGLNGETLAAMGAKSEGAWYEKSEKGDFRIGGILPKSSLAMSLTGLVQQVSWQMEKLVPICDGEVVATWADRAGEDSGIAAAVHTMHGFVFGHVFQRSGAPLFKVMVAKLWPTASARAAAKIAKRKAELTAFSTAADAWAKSLPGKSGERRLMWCHSPLGLRKNGDWETSVRELKACGYTDIIVNFAWGYGADYPSHVVPHTPLVDCYGDLFAAAQAACRKYGVKLHAWLVCWPMARGIDKSYAEKLDREGRLQYNTRGVRVRTNNTTWLCPSSPENRKLLGDVMIELADKGADGVHFDYIRYPGESACYCGNCRKRFEAMLGRGCADWPRDVAPGGVDRTAWVKFRVSSISALVKRVGEEIHSRYPGVEVSAAVFRDPRGDVTTVGQDWAGWLEAGYADFVCPMDYTWNLDDFREYLRDQKEIVGTARIYPGIGLTSSARFPQDGGDAYRFSEQVLSVREAGFPGFTCFNFDGRCLKAMQIAREGVLR